jgi:transcriptional regulator with XRE-family HTH domain
MKPTDRAIVFGKVLRERRLHLKLTQREVVAHCGFSSMFLSDMERGLRTMPLHHFGALASALDCAESWLYSHAGYCSNCSGTGKR